MIGTDAAANRANGTANRRPQVRPAQYDAVPTMVVNAINMVVNAIDAVILIPPVLADRTPRTPARPARREVQPFFGRP